MPLNLLTIKFKKMMRRKARFGEVRKESGWLKQVEEADKIPSL